MKRNNMMASKEYTTIGYIKTYSKNAALYASQHEWMQNWYINN